MERGLLCIGALWRRALGAGEFRAIVMTNTCQTTVLLEVERRVKAAQPEKGIPMKTKIILLTIMSATGLLQGCGQPQPAVSPEPVKEEQKEETAVAPAETMETEEEAKVAVPAIDISTLALKVDPVCKMSLEEYPATASAEYEGKTYGFCSDFCKRKFDGDPAKMLARVAHTPVGE